MITIYRGEPGQGKTYFLSLEILDLIRRNLRWHKTGLTKKLRPIAANMAISQWVKNIYPEIIYWNDLKELINLKGADIIFDDMSNYLDSQRWADTPLSVKRWLRYHEHYGIDIYGNAQDFMTIDPSVRRLTTELYSVRKIMGSRRPGMNKPPVKNVWGLVIRRRLDLTGVKMQTSIDESSINSIGWPRIEFIKKKVCNVYNTNEDFSELEYPHLDHIVRSCLICHKEVIKHI